MLGKHLNRDCVSHLLSFIDMDAELNRFSKTPRYKYMNHDVYRYIDKYTKYICIMGFTSSFKKKYYRKKLIEKNNLHFFIFEHGTSNLIKHIISKGIDMDCVDRYGYRPIHLITNNPDLRLFKHLINEGVYLGYKTHQGDTFMDLIWQNGAPKVIDYFINYLDPLT